jgi:hypothetical protein
MGVAGLGRLSWGHGARAPFVVCGIHFRTYHTAIFYLGSILRVGKACYWLRHALLHFRRFGRGVAGCGRLSLIGLDVYLVAKWGFDISSCGTLFEGGEYA